MQFLVLLLLAWKKPSVSLKNRLSYIDEIVLSVRGTCIMKLMTAWRDILRTFDLELNADKSQAFSSHISPNAMSELTAIPDSQLHSAAIVVSSYVVVHCQLERATSQTTVSLFLSRMKLCLWELRASYMISSPRSFEPCRQNAERWFVLQIHSILVVSMPVYIAESVSLCV